MTKCWIPPLFAILVSVCGAAQDLAIQQATVHVTDDGATATSDYRFQPMRCPRRRGPAPI